MIPISVCIITKNEAANLQKCLASLQPYPFEIVVVDTGSTDDTLTVARNHTDRIYEFSWIDDFSAARNFAASCASHDLLFPIDSDEVLTPFVWETLQAAVAAHPESVGNVGRSDYYETDAGLQCYQVRIERLYDRRYYQFRGAIHEALVPIGNLPYTSYETSIILDHSGYLGDAQTLRQKAERNLALLQKEISKEPHDPYPYFQAAQAYLLMRDKEQACNYFQSAIACDPSPTADYTRMLVDNYGNCLLDLDRPEEAVKLLSYYEYYDDCMDYLCMIGLVYMMIGQPLRALPEFVKAINAPVRDSVDPRSPSYYVGYLYEFFGKEDIARSHYQNCGDYAPAVEALKRLEG